MTLSVRKIGGGRHIWGPLCREGLFAGKMGKDDGKTGMAPDGMV
jgi:hypothetical protein